MLVILVLQRCMTTNFWGCCLSSCIVYVQLYSRNACVQILNCGHLRIYNEIKVEGQTILSVMSENVTSEHWDPMSCSMIITGMRCCPPAECTTLFIKLMCRCESDTSFSIQLCTRLWLSCPLQTWGIEHRLAALSANLQCVLGEGSVHTSATAIHRSVYRIYGNAHLIANIGEWTVHHTTSSLARNTRCL